MNRVCLELKLLDNSTLYTNRTPGLLKLVCHGQRMERGEGSIWTGACVYFDDWLWKSIAFLISLYYNQSRNGGYLAWDFM